MCPCTCRQPAFKPLTYYIVVQGTILDKCTLAPWYTTHLLVDLLLLPKAQTPLTNTPLLLLGYRHHAYSNRSSNELAGMSRYTLPFLPSRHQLINSQNLFFGFAGLVTAAAAWSIWGQDMFPQREDPKGDPQTWSEEDLRHWLNSVRVGNMI